MVQRGKKRGAVSLRGERLLPESNFSLALRQTLIVLPGKELSAAREKSRHGDPHPKGEIKSSHLRNRG